MVGWYLVIVAEKFPTAYQTNSFSVKSSLLAEPSVRSSVGLAQMMLRTFTCITLATGVRYALMSLLKLSVFI